MNDSLPTWVTPGAEVFELHCSTRDYSVKKTVPTTIARVERGRIILATGGRYDIVDGSTFDGVTRYQRSDAVKASRYYLLVSLDDDHANR